MNLLCCTLSSSLIQDYFLLEKKGSHFPLPEPDNVLYCEHYVSTKKFNDVRELAMKYGPDCKWFYNTLRSDIAASDEVDGSDKAIASDTDT